MRRRPGSIITERMRWLGASRRQWRNMALGDEPRYQKMTPQEWAGIQDNPFQRDTQRHADFVVNRTLHEPFQKHMTVVAVVLDGVMYKSDGHTRSLLWQQGRLPAPAIVIVEIWDAETIEDVEKLYKSIDNAASAEKGSDRAFTARKKHGINVISKKLVAGGYLSALKQAYRICVLHASNKEEEEDKAHAFFAREIEFADTLAPTDDRFPIPVLAAVFVTKALYPTEPIVTEFWNEYANGGGSKLGTQVDAIQGLNLLVLETRGQRGSNTKNKNEIFMAKVMSCVERYRRNLFYQMDHRGRTPRVRALDLKDIRQRISAAKGAAR